MTFASMVAAFTASDWNVFVTCPTSRLASDNSERAKFLQRRHGRVLANRKTARQSFRQPVGRHERGFAQEFVALESAPAEADFAVGRLKSCERSHQLGLAVARDPRNADDLSARNVEAHILEFSSAQSLNGQVDFLRNALRLRRKRRPERATDDHAQQILIRHVGHQRPTAHAAVSQHRDAMRDLADLRETMGNVDDRRSGLDHRANAVEQQFGRTPGRAKLSARRESAPWAAWPGLLQSRAVASARPSASRRAHVAGPQDQGRSASRSRRHEPVDLRTPIAAARPEDFPPLTNRRGWRGADKKSKFRAQQPFPETSETPDGPRIRFRRHPAASLPR